jgi:pimeloyl-ACP methyl ester carboxylesterase
MGECNHAGLSRREALAAIAGAAISAVAIPGASNARSQEGNKMSYLLIHPAWFGGWCWKKLTPLLRAQGHEVFTPTLTGLGARAHLARPDIGLQTHVRDITNVIEYEDLRNVVLVGNSSGGMVITGVADHMPERIAHIVFLDAFVPTDGQSMLDVIPPDRRPVLEAFVQKEGDGWLLPRFAPPPWEKLVTEAWQVTERTDIEWILPRLRPTPFGHFKEPVTRKNPAAETLPRTYIRTQWPHPGFDRYAEAASAAAGWQLRKIASSHLPYVTHPGELAPLLLEVAG